MRAKYGHLLTDSNIERWYKNVARGSEVRADVYVRRLGNFCDDHRLTPKSLASMSDEKLYDLLMDFVSSEADS